MADFDINSVLSQLRALSSQATTGIGSITPPLKPDAKAEGLTFGNVLKSAVEAVDRTQKSAEQAATDFELGKGDLSTAVLATQTAQVSFKAMTEARNRMVRAYQDIMNMPI
ncbi:MAG TPA: flagellar hook-basal body complex protein FliE [Nevskiaceae bacterium]|nr:flagellar hook-basal body complex protein FliE [Nevskiaceae bacterium]